MKQFQPGEIWLDTNGVPINAHGGGILWHEGNYYWFGEHKTEGERGNRAWVGVHVYGSEDLYHWTDCGVALAVSEDPASEIKAGCILERPKVVFCAKTGRFVMWFHLEPSGEGYGGARSGVAVADAPTGPFHYLGSVRPNAGSWPKNVSEADQRPLTTEELEYVSKLELPGGPLPYYPKQLGFRRDFTGGQMARDMTLFVDDDGAAYHIYSSEDNGTMHISKLAEDFLSHTCEFVRVLPGRFNEAPTIMKRAGHYFMITSDCTGWAPNPARLLKADSIWGPWEEMGNPCTGPGSLITNTYNSQSTFILPVQGMDDAFIFMADRWNPKNAIDGRYVWLPIFFKHGVPLLAWHDEWDLSFFQ